METKYFCEICGTKPDQLSHHKAHLQTQKHADNCEIFKKDMRIFSASFRHVSPQKWYESDYKDYIIAKYINETKNELYNDEDIKKWIIEVTIKRLDDNWTLDIFDYKIPHECYEKEFNCKLTKTYDITNVHFNDWAIDRILKFKETIQKRTIQSKLTKSSIYTNVSNKSSFHRMETKNKMMLSRYTNVKFNKIKEIRNGCIDLKYLFEPREQINLNECDIEIYDDTALRYSCLLFHEFGIHYYILYKIMSSCIDINEFSEKKKHDSFYFWKEVEIEHSSKIENVSGYDETRIEKRKIWTSCCMSDVIKYCNYLTHIEVWSEDIPAINYTYISNDGFKYFIKETLVKLFTDIIDSFKMQQSCINYFSSETENKEKEIEELEEKIKYYTDETLKIEDLNISSELFNSIFHICQYLFEYDENLFEYYKTHTYINTMNYQKEKLIESVLEEETENILFNCHIIQ